MAKTWVPGDQVTSTELNRIEGDVVRSAKKDETNVFTATWAPATGPNPGQIHIAPTSADSAGGIAMLHLVPNNAAYGIPGNGQDRDAIIAFSPEKGEVEDATIKCHRHTDDTGTPTNRHIQIHTKNAAGTDLLSRLEIKYLTDDAEILVTSAHLRFDENAYFKGRASDNKVEFRGDPIIVNGGPVVSFKQSGDGLITHVGRLTSGGPVAVRPATGSDATAGLRVEKADATILFQVQSDGILHSPPAANWTVVANAGGVHTVPATCRKYLYVRSDTGSLLKIACYDP